MDQETRQEIIRLRNEEKMTYRAIAKKVDFSFQYVAMILNDEGYYGELDYPELRNPATFDELDILVALRLGISKAKVINARVNLGIPKIKAVDIPKRRNHLAERLFGCQAGKKFADWVLQLTMDNLTIIQAALIVDFYVTGKTESLASNSNTDSDRVYRSVTVRNLKKLVENVSVDGLLEKGVLCR